MKKLYVIIIMNPYINNHKIEKIFQLFWLIPDTLGFLTIFSCMHLSLKSIICAECTIYELSG